MKVVQFIYENNFVDFLTPGNENVMVNATQMAKIFNKRVTLFMENDNTKNFIKACLKSRNSDYINISKEEDLYRSTQKSGTWMHRILALKFAAWLDPDFELWVFSTIDKIILGTYAEHRRATIDQLQAKKDMEQKRMELLEKYPEFAEYMELENKLIKRNFPLYQLLKSEISRYF